MSVQVGDLGYADELGNYAEYSGAPNEEETLQYARSLIDVRVSSPNESNRSTLGCAYWFPRGTCLKLCERNCTALTATRVRPVSSCPLRRMRMS